MFSGMNMANIIENVVKKTFSPVQEKFIFTAETGGMK